MRVVIDASAVVELIVGEIDAETARLLEEREPIAPALLDAEVVHAIAGLARSRKIDDARAEIALADLADLPVERSPLPPLVPGAWSLRHNLSLYDAFYVALARELECPLLTADSRLARSPRLGIKLIVSA